MSPTDRRSTLLSLLGFAILVASTSAILVRLSEAPVVVKVLYRLLFTSAFLVAAAVVRYRDDFDRLSRRDFGTAVATGVVLSVHYLAWFESLEWTTVAASVTLGQTQVIFVAIGAALLLGERVTPGAAVGMLVGLSGAAIVTTGGLVTTDLLQGTDPVLGNGLALVAGALFGMYLLAGRSLRQRVATVPYLTLVYGVAAVVTTVFAIGSGAAIAPTAYPLREHLIFLGLALGPGLVAQGLVNWLLAYLRSAVVSVSFLGVPIASTILAALVLAETPGLLTAGGGALVLVGIYATVRARPAS